MSTALLVATTEGQRERARRCIWELQQRGCGRGGYSGGGSPPAPPPPMTMTITITIYLFDWSSSFASSFTTGLMARKGARAGATLELNQPRTINS